MAQADIPSVTPNVKRAHLTYRRSERVGYRSTSKDEMCNFYIMYYVDGDHTIADHYCFTAGPPTWSWEDFGGLDASLAPLTASMVPGTDQLLEATERFMDDQRQRVDDQLARLLWSLEDSDDNDAEEYAMRNAVPSYDDLEDEDLYDRRVNYID